MNKWNNNRIEGVKAVRMTAAKPEAPISGAYVVKMRVDVPVDVFLPTETPVITVGIDGAQAQIVALARDLAQGK